MSETQSYSVVKVWAYCLTISLSSLYYGYNISAFNGSMDTISGTLHWGDRKTLFTTMFTAAFPFGAILTTMFAGKVMEMFGRRRTLMITSIVAILVHLFSMIPNTWTFGLGRLFVGMLGGFVTAIPPSFLNEVSPTAISGRTGTLVQLMITFGIILPGIFCLPLPINDYANSDKKDLWMFIFGFPVIISMLQLLLFCCVAKYDSPMWLLKKGRNDEAKAFYRYIYGEDGMEKALEMAQAQTPLTKEMHKGDSYVETNETTYTLRDLFLTSKFRRMLHLCIMVQVMQQWSGVNAIFAYSATMFSFGTFTNRVFSLVLAIVNFLATCFSIPFVDKFGRRPLLIIGTLGCAVSLAATGICSIVDQPYASIVFVIIFIIFFEQSLGPVVWIFCGETFPDNAMGVSVMTNWICFFILVLVFPILVAAIKIYVCFWIFAVICALGVLYFWVFIFETKGKPKEENMRKCLGEISKN